MPLPERTYRHVDTSRSPTPIASVEQFLRGTGTGGGDSSRKSPTYSPTSSSPSSPYFERLKHHDPEEDHGLYQKKSVLTKVKEKARKFRYSLSKRRMEDENVTPSWGVSLDDDEEEEEDAEYLGAPMYESELAPEGYKENARQHPRANPVISEKHVLHNTVKLGVEQDREKSRGPVNAKSTTTTSNITSETIAQKLTPINAGGSIAANSISSKIQAAVSTTAPAANNNMSSQTSSVPSSPRQNSSSSSASLSGNKNARQKSASLKDHLMNKAEQGDDARTVSSMQKSSSSSSASLSEKNTSQKSASVKDYMMNKSEPMDDANKTVSQPQVTSEATSPMRTSSNPGVIDKVRGAVNSLLGNEEPSQQYGVKIPTTRTSSQTQQVDQEENRGRILQAN